MKNEGDQTPIYSPQKSIYSQKNHERTDFFSALDGGYAAVKSEGDLIPIHQTNVEFIEGNREMKEGRFRGGLVFKARRLFITQL